MSDVAEIFNRLNAEYHKFEKVVAPLHPRRDLAAFLFLDQLLPGAKPIISASEHDEVYLNVDVDELLKVAQESDWLCLVRCGVSYNESLNSLYMFT